MCFYHYMYPSKSIDASVYTESMLRIRPTHDKRFQQIIGTNVMKEATHPAAYIILNKV